jgi:hypothetical protein
MTLEWGKLLIITESKSHQWSVVKFDCSIKQKKCLKTYSRQNRTSITKFNLSKEQR